jgi:hypothetical protein
MKRYGAFVRSPRSMVKRLLPQKQFIGLSLESLLRDASGIQASPKQFWNPLTV